jgi:hypothetical protein
VKLGLLSIALVAVLFQPAISFTAGAEKPRPIYTAGAAGDIGMDVLPHNRDPYHRRIREDQGGLLSVFPSMGAP